MAKFKPYLQYDEESWTLKNSFVLREIRRCNRNQLILMLVLFGLLLSLFIYPFAVKTFFSRQAAVEMPAGEVLALTEESLSLRLPFSATYENSEEYRGNVYLKRVCVVRRLQCRFSLTAEEILPSGIVPVKNDVPTIDLSGLPGNTELPEDAQSAGKSYIEYVLLRFGDRYLLTKQPVGSESTTLSGMLCYLPKDILKVASEASGIDADRFIPVFFDAGGEIFASLKTDLLFWAILFLLWLCFFIPLVRRMADPTRHEAYAKIYVYAGDTAENIRSLDRELGGENVVQTLSKIVTPSWIITRKFMSFEAKMKDRG